MLGRVNTRWFFGHLFVNSWSYCLFLLICQIKDFRGCNLKPQIIHCRRLSPWSIIVDDVAPNSQVNGLKIWNHHLYFFIAINVSKKFNIFCFTKIIKSVFFLMLACCRLAVKQYNVTVYILVFIIGANGKVQGEGYSIHRECYIYVWSVHVDCFALPYCLGFVSTFSLAWLSHETKKISYLWCFFFDQLLSICLMFLEFFMRIFWMLIKCFQLFNVWC